MYDTMAVSALSESACTPPSPPPRRPSDALLRRVPSDKFGCEVEDLVAQFKRAQRAHAAARAEVAALERDAWRERLRAQKMEMRRAPPAELAAQAERVRACEALLGDAEATAADAREALERVLDSLLSTLRRAFL